MFLFMVLWVYAVIIVHEFVCLQKLDRSSFFILTNYLESSLNFLIFKWQFAWRPRPPSFLTPEKEEEIAKNLKKYSKKYEAEDQDVSMLLSEQEREKRRMLKEEWEKWLNEWKRLHEEEKLLRQKLRDGEASDEEEEYEAKEVEVEEILDVTEDVLSDDFDQE